MSETADNHVLASAANELAWQLLASDYFLENLPKKNDTKVLALGLKIYNASMKNALDKILTPYLDKIRSEQLSWYVRINKYYVPPIYSAKNLSVDSN